MDRKDLAGLAGELGLALRDEVLPALGRPEGRAHVSGAAQGSAGGDVTFAIDERAESFLERFLARRAPDVAFYSEDRGMVVPGSEPAWVLVVDPIDGTRPAMAGLESACVSVAAAPLDGEPRIRDVEVACVVEIKSGIAFRAERGAGVEPAPRLSANRDMRRMFWAYGLRGRPVRAIAEVLGEVIDASSVGGATFDLGSACFAMTRIATGQLDAYIEPGPRIVADVPGMREEFERVGGGAVLNNSPYDLAAAVLCLEEAGAVVSDAYGRPLGERSLLGSGADFQISCVAAANRDLHAAIVEAIDSGIDRLAQVR
ncbi:MAG TPA: inositol monophosphatase family protein [Solirubrobacterales bacterium]|nr:inositol monophosphatase family protein [Solirubrobacterales bacterium]